MEYIWNEFPTFCVGFFYLMSKNTAIQLLTKFEEAPRQNYIWIEDVYLTGLLLNNPFADLFHKGLPILFICMGRVQLIIDENINLDIFNTLARSKSSLDKRKSIGMT